MHAERGYYLFLINVDCRHLICDLLKEIPTLLKPRAERAHDAASECPLVELVTSKQACPNRVAQPSNPDVYYLWLPGREGK